MDTELVVLKIQTGLKNGILSGDDIVCLTETAVTKFGKTYFDLSKPATLVLNIPEGLYTKEQEENIKRRLFFDKTYALKAVGFKEFDYKITHEDNDFPKEEIMLDQDLDFVFKED